MKRKYSFFLIIFILLIICYYGVLSGYFVSEDWEWIPKIESLTFLNSYQIFLPHVWGGIKAAIYRPVIPFTFWVNFRLFGLNPFGYHLTNLIFHFANVLLIYQLVVTLDKTSDRYLRSILPFIGAAIYALLPFSEAVSWIDGRYDVFVTFFYLLSLLTYFASKIKNRSFLKLFSLISFILALLSKENALTLPFIIILIELFKRQRLVIRRLINYFLILGVWGVIRYLFSTTPFVHLIFNGPFVSRLFQGYLAGSLVFTIVYLEVKLKFKKRLKLPLTNLVLFWIMLGLLLLPTAMLPTEERFVYLPLVAGTLIFIEIFKLLFFIFRKKYSLRVAWILISTCIIITIISEAHFLIKRNQRYVIASKIAWDIIQQTKNLVKPNITNLYFLGLPDNYQGALIYRTYLNLALRYNKIFYGKVIVFPQTNGLGNNQLQITSEQLLAVQSNLSFWPFKPAISGYTESHEPIIENNQYRIVFQSASELSINLKQDKISNPQSLFILYNKGILIPVEYEKE